MQIVDSIDWRRVKNVRTLCVVGEIYAANKRYEESKEIFLLAYHRAPIGKNILYRLIEVSLKMGQISEATEFFDEYREVAGNDNSQYILRYKIARAKNASLNEQIRILEEYKEKEFTERWSYELAKLYYKAGDKQKCLDLCNEMILWFNDGNYVMKALDLKQRMGVLTGEEKEKYEQRFIPKLIPPEKAKEIRESKETETAGESEYEESRPVTDTIQVDDERDLNSAETFQEKISKGIRDIFGGHKKAAEEPEDMEEDVQDESEDSTEEEAEDVQEGEETPEEETAATEESAESEETDSEDTEEEIPESEDGEELLSSGIENLSGGTAELKAEIQKEAAEPIQTTEQELSQSVAEIMKASQEKESEEPSGVPLNEEGKPDFSATIRMPQLKIPKSMINVDPENASAAAKIPDASEIFGSIDEIAAEVAKDKETKAETEEEQEFNLEDTILAAATEQGIDIPEEEKSPDVQMSNVTEETDDEDDLDIVADEFVPEEPDAADIEDIMAQISAQQAEDAKQSERERTRVPDLILDEDEEPVTEEDMQAAEAEFLNGPAGVSKPVEEDAFEDIEELNEEALTDMPEELSLDEAASEDDTAEKTAEKLDDVATVVEEETPLDEEEEYSTDDVSVQSEAEDDEEDDFISSLTEDMEEDDSEEELTEEEQLERFIEDIQPEIDPNTIISRKRQLTDEEKQLFTYFVAVPGMKEQLLDVLCDVQTGAADHTSQTGNVIVMGGRETGKTRLISSLIPAICKELNIEASKVAYIFAEDLNGKNIAEIASKLAGGFLVIENANQLSQETADELDEVMNGNTKGMIVILEDEKIGMRKLIARYPKLAKKFTSMINIPVFTNDELVNFAKVYTMENGFRIDQMGMLALYNLIGINQKEDQPMCIGTVKTMLDNAMAKAQGGLFKRSKKRVDRDGFTVLLEKDFS
ncbi:hypothetical protein G5B06_07670 [Blautia luti]|nr:hypothetical protein [Blautia luti]OLA52686.1 MAG: hypothetical protein BHW53_00600 [Ruminococcus sp. CAG:108-related_41_35]